MTFVQRPIPASARLLVEPGDEALERRRDRRPRSPGCRAARSPRVDRDDPVVVAHDRRPGPSIDEDRREAHRRQARTVGSARSGATAARMTSAMPPDAGPALERDGRLGDEHLRAVRGAQAARPGRREQRRLGRDVDEVEHGRRRRQHVDRRWSCPGSSIPTVVALTARSAVRSAAAKAGSSEGDAVDRTPARRPAKRSHEPAGRRVRRPIADRHPARPGLEAREHDGVRRAAGARRRRPRRRPAAGPSPARRRRGTPARRC